MNAQQRIEQLEIQLATNDKAKSHLVSTPTLKAVLKSAKDVERFKYERILQENNLRYYKEKFISAEIENKRLRSENEDLEKLVMVRG